MIEYPKIETLYNRNDKFIVDPSQLRKSEFELIKRWWVTEKIDGTNIRVMWNFAEKKLTFGGRTDNTNLYPPLVSYLQALFTPDKFTEFENDVILFGEGYGPKIQKGGGLYRGDISFRLFDILIGQWWIEPDNMRDLAEKFGCNIAPPIGFIETLPEDIGGLARIVGEKSFTALFDGGQGCRPEGIVARSWPLLFDRSGHRVMWKLKYKDFG